MKKIIYYLFIVHCIICPPFGGLKIVHCQTGWFWSYPLPQGNSLSNLQMLDASTGFCLNPDNMLRTTNGGLNWQLIYPRKNSYNLNMFMIDANTGYLCADSTLILKTTNSGLNWFEFPIIENISHPRIFFVSQNIGFILSGTDINYHLGYTKILRTSNSGNTWNQVVDDTIHTLFFYSFPSTSVIYLAGRQFVPEYGYKLAILKTTNSGISWDSIQTNITGQAWSIFFISEIIGFISADNRIYKTTNGGITWILNFTTYSPTRDIHFLDLNYGYLTDGSDYYRTSNGGMNWINNYYYQFSNNTFFEIYFNNISTGLAVGSSGAVIRTSNSGLNWSQLAGGEDYLLEDIRFSDVNTGFAVENMA